MRKSDLREGLTYLVRPSDHRLQAIIARLDRIEERADWRGRDVTTYRATCTEGGRKLRLYSAQQFLEVYHETDEGNVGSYGRCAERSAGRGGLPGGPRIQRGERSDDSGSSQGPAVDLAGAGQKGTEADAGNCAKLSKDQWLSLPTEMVLRHRAQMRLAMGAETPLADLLRRSLEDLLGALDTAELLRVRCESPNVQLQEYCHKELHRRGAAKEPYRSRS